MIGTVRPPTEQVPGVYRRRLGDLVVTALSDGYFDAASMGAGLEVLLNISAEDAQTLLQRAGRPVRARASINAFAIHAGGRVALIDAGSGPTLGPTAGRLPAALAAAGIQADEIDTVLLTHLHPDHSAGLIDPAGVPVFPQAELHLHADELAYWRDDTALSRATEPNRSFFPAARAQLGAYRDRLHALQPGEVFPGVTWMPMPGHSPGHTAYRIGSGDASLLIWGDVVTIQEVQIPRPEAGFIFDLDPQGAAATRRRALDMAATDRLLVAGMHLHFPGFGRVVRDGPSFRLVPDVWSVWSDEL